MGYAKKIVLVSKSGYQLALDALVEQFIRDGVKFVGVVGEDCAKVEDIIDEIVVGDGNNDNFILTSSHPGESVEEVIEFAHLLSLECVDEVQVVEF